MTGIAERPDDDFACACVICSGAEEAILSGRFARRGDLYFVADVFITEAFAGGVEVPPTPQLERADGRVVYLFRAPEWDR